jgi:hypothetical protein
MEHSDLEDAVSDAACCVANEQKRKKTCSSSLSITPSSLPASITLGGGNTGKAFKNIEARAALDVG